MGACTAFIFAALIEFTFVNYLWRKQRINYALNAAARGRLTAASPRTTAAIFPDPAANGNNGIDEADEDGVVMMMAAVGNKTPPEKLFDEEETRPRKRLVNGRVNGGLDEDDILGPTTSMAVRFDESCRILFQLYFLCFNIFYWVYYLYS